jgi:hypothetical protein
MIPKKAIGFLIVLLILLVAAPAAFAADPVELVFNGQKFNADITLKDGVSYIPAAALKRIPGLEVDEGTIVPVRALFESQGGTVSWDNANRQVIVSWREKSGDYTADELVVRSSELLKEINSYKMKSSNLVEFEFAGIQDLMAMPGMPRMEILIEGVFQYEPMAMYMKQTMKMPLAGLELSPEELEAAGLGDGMVTEMVWFDNAIYQKLPMSDQWVYQELTGLEETLGLNNLMQMTPQQSLELLAKAGVINVFGDDVVKEDGREYYTIKNYIDAESFKSLTNQILGNIDLASLVAAAGAQPNSQGTADLTAQFGTILESVLNNMEVNYYIDTLINKETLLSDYMNFDMNMTINFKQLVETIAEMSDADEAVKAAIPEGPMNIQFKMQGDCELYDYGTALELPDLSNAISQEEYVKQLMAEMEVIEEVEI